LKCPVNLKLNNLENIIQINENEPGSKRGKYFQKTNDGKQILRNVMQKYVPANIINAEKQGFSSPDASWFKGESINFVRRCLFNDNARIYDFMDRVAVESLVQQHLIGQQNRRLLIWSLINFEEYLSGIE
jgi:asparagine synthase (glutamine-hydrolysing)